MDEYYLDLIDQAFFERQIDGEVMELACSWIEMFHREVRNGDEISRH